MTPAWFPDWSGQTCAVVGSGESANRETVDRLRELCRVLVINNSFRLAPWADALYACDGKWWAVYHGELATFGGLKITQDRDAAARFGLRNIDLVELNDPQANEITVAKPGVIGRGGFGGFQAINLAVQFGAKRLLLVGFDFVGGHWHGPHETPLRNPRPQSLLKWAQILDAQQERLHRLGVEVVNLSAISASAGYRKSTIDQVLDERVAA